MTVSLRSQSFGHPFAGHAGVVGLLDVGTTHIVCMIVSADAAAASGFQLLGLGHQISRGVKASMVVDLEAAQEAIWSSIYQAQRMAGVSLEHVHVAAGGGRLEHLMVSSTVPTGRGILTADDLTQLDAAGRAYAQRDERVVLHLDRLQLGMDGVAVLRPQAWPELSCAQGGFFYCHGRSGGGAEPAARDREQFAADFEPYRLRP